MSFAFFLPLVNVITDFDLLGEVQFPTHAEPDAKPPSFLVGALSLIEKAVYSHDEKKGRCLGHGASQWPDELPHIPVRFVSPFVVCGAVAHAE